MTSTTKERVLMAAIAFAIAAIVTTAAAFVVLSLWRPSPDRGELVTALTPLPGPGRLAVRQRISPTGTRVVSCGVDGHATGSDSAGTAVLGDGALGACTLVFARSSSRLMPQCSVSAGRIAEMSAAEIRITGLGSATWWTWSCK